MSVTYTAKFGYAWFITNGYLMCAPEFNDGTVDWNNAGESDDMTEVTAADMDAITYDLGLDAWPKMGTLPGEFNRS